MSLIYIISSPENAGEGGKKGLGKQGEKKKINNQSTPFVHAGRTHHPESSESEWARGTVLRTAWLD